MAKLTILTQNLSFSQGLDFYFTLTKIYRKKKMAKMGKEASLVKGIQFI